MPLSTHYGLALVSVLMLPSSGLVDVAPAANCTAPACADLETSSLLQMRGDGPMGHLSEADTSSTLLTEGMDLKKSAIIVIDLQNDFVHPNGTLSNAGAHIGVIEPVNKLLRLDWGVRIFTADNHPANHVSFSKNHQSESFIPNGAFPLVDLQYSSLVGTPTAKICGPDYMSTYGEAGQICNGFPTPSGEAYSPDISVPQETYPAHCVQSTWGQKIYEEVNFSHSRLSDMYVLKGENAHIDSYSAIFNNLACNATLRYNHSNGQPIPLTCIPEQKPYPGETQIPQILWKSGVERVFFVGLCLDYCVKYSSIHSAFLGTKKRNRWKTYLIEDATEPCNPSKFHVWKSIQQMKAAGVIFLRTADVKKHSHQERRSSTSS